MSSVALLMPGGFARQRVGHFHLPAARFRPALVHAQQHVRPIARFRAARAGVDAQDAVVFVVRAVEKTLQFQVLELFGELVQVASPVPSRTWAGPPRVRLRQFQHRLEILELLFRLEQRLDFFAERNWPRQSASAPARGCSRNCPPPSERPARPGVFARPGRQRNLRKCVSFSATVSNCPLMTSNISPQSSRNPPPNPEFIAARQDGGEWTAALRNLEGANWRDGVASKAKNCGNFVAYCRFLSASVASHHGGGRGKARMARDAGGVTAATPYRTLKCAYS